MAFITWDNNSEFLTFDVTLSEKHTSTSEVTKYPVEKGAAITDHVRPAPSQVELTVFVSNSPLHGGVAKTTEVRYLKVLNSADTLTINAPKYDRPPGFTPGAVVAKLVDVIGEALFGEGPDYRVQGQATEVVIATATFAGRSIPRDGDRRINLIEKLEKLRDDATLCNVFTATGFYSDVVLSGVDFDRNKPTDGLPISLKFENLRIVETSSVAAPKVRVSRAKAPEVKGAQDEAKEKKETLAAYAAAKARAALGLPPKPKGLIP